MSNITSLRERHEPSTSKVVLSSILARNAVSAVSKEFSRLILASTVDEAKTIQHIGLEQGVPSSTCYRRVRELVDEGLMIIERIVLTGDGKRYALYRSAFKTFEVVSDFRTISVSAEINEQVADKVRRIGLTFGNDGQSMGVA